MTRDDRSNRATRPADWDEARQRIQERIAGATRWAREMADLARQEAARIKEQVAARVAPDTGPGALSTFIRPDPSVLGPTPEPLRRLLEPVIAAWAILTMGALLGVGAVGFSLMFAAAALLYLILTRVFGLELDVKMPV